MVSRSVHANTATALTSGVIRPVLIVRMAIDSDPLLAWNGPGIFAPTTTGDAALDGYTFQPGLPALSISDIEELLDGSAGPVTFTVAGHDLDEELLRQVARDKQIWHGQRAWIWKGLLNADEATVVNYPFRRKAGVITQMVVREDDKGSFVVVTVDDDIARLRGHPVLWTSHARLFPGDTFGSYVRQLANKPGGFTSAPVPATGAGGRTSGHPTTTNPF